MISSSRKSSARCSEPWLISSRAVTFISRCRGAANSRRMTFVSIDASRRISDAPCSSTSSWRGSRCGARRQPTPSTGWSGALLVDAASRVLFANKEAERLTGIGGGLRLVAGILLARSTADTAKLQTLVAGCGRQGDEAGAGGSLSLPRAVNRSAITLLVVPLRTEAPAFFVVRRPVAITFATDPDRHPAPPIAQIRQRYGLTRAE